MEHFYVIDPLHSEENVEKVRKALAEIPEVEGSLVSPHYTQVVVRLNKPVSLDIINKELKKAGDFELRETYS